MRGEIVFALAMSVAGATAGALDAPILNSTPEVTGAEAAGAEAEYVAATNDYFSVGANSEARTSALQIILDTTEEHERPDGDEFAVSFAQADQSVAQAAPQETYDQLGDQAAEAIEEVDERQDEAEHKRDVANMPEIFRRGWNTIQLGVVGLVGGAALVLVGDACGIRPRRR
jgi:hypothetical protein